VITKIVKLSALHSRECLKLSACLLVLSFSTSSYATCTEEWIARIVSIQGSVEVRKQNAGEKNWQPVNLQQTYCLGDTFRVKHNSRAAVELHNDTILRLDQNTTLVLSGPKKDVSWLDLLKGSLHSISRVPRSLKIKTPFVNAGVEGTEFLVSVKEDNTLVGVIEGTVLVDNEFGRVLLARDQSAITYNGKAPVLRLDINPTDSVQWSLYYPSLNVAELKQAEDLIRVGQTEAAEALLKGNASAEALSLRSIIAIAQNNKQEALKLAQQAIQTNPESVVAHLSHSYALQASFDLPAAKRAAKTAVKKDNNHAIAWTRLAELQLSLSELDHGLASAKRAVDIEPSLARTQTLLGYAYLLQYQTDKAKQSFEQAIKLDSSDPLARLGNGLATIRDGDLKQGRREIEIAASLDTNNAQVRSYLGKAYLEEKRNKLAAEQFVLAKQMDPNDPTPWLYNALLKQSENAPVEALRELEQSIKLNNNRAVYRSSLSLDDDQATRGAGLGRIYQDLGFEQLALNEASKSLAVNPGSSSAHRLLADAYLFESQHDIARVSELLQAQMLQPINTTPLQPQMSESTLSFLNNLGVNNAGFNEYSSLFLRNQARIDANTLVAGNNTFASEIILSGVSNKLSISAGKYSYETDGFHSNNEDDQLLENVFLQYAATTDTSLLFEVSNNDREYGDFLRFDPANFLFTLNNQQKVNRRRIGLTHKFSPNSILMMTRMKEDRFEGSAQGMGFLTFGNNELINTSANELRYLFDQKHWQITAGYTFHKSSVTENTIDPFFSFPSVDSFQRSSSAYLYGYIESPDLDVTAGLSRDKFKSNKDIDRDESTVLPKFGVEASLGNDMTMRMAYFKTTRRPIVNDQTLEPTTIAGFNQFYDDLVGTNANNYAAALDYSSVSEYKFGFEVMKRDMKVPFVLVSGAGSTLEQANWSNEDAGFYFYWLPRKDFSTSIRLSRINLKRDRSVGGENLISSKIYQLPINVNWFHNSGWVTRGKLTYVRQNGLFQDLRTRAISQGKDNFLIADGSLEYRFRKNSGSFVFGVLNLFDKEFRYQDIDIDRQLFSPDRTAFARLNLTF